MVDYKKWSNIYNGIGDENIKIIRGAKNLNGESIRGS